MPKRSNLNQKSVIWFSVFLFTCILLIGLLQFINYRMINPVEITKLHDEVEVIWEIEEIKSSKDYISISGWAMIYEEQLRTFDISVILENIGTKEAFEIQTVLVVRDDLNNVYPGSIDYSNSGFYSTVNKNQIGLENNSFEIYIKYFNNDNELFIKTNQILSNDFQ